MRKDDFPIVDKFVKDSINEVLDKIRADIELLKADGLANMDAVLSVIDRYFSQD